MKDEKGNFNFVVSDRSRCMIKYLDENKNIITDEKGIKIINATKDPILSKSESYKKKAINKYSEMCGDEEISDTQFLEARKILKKLFNDQKKIFEGKSTPLMKGIIGKMKN